MAPSTKNAPPKGQATLATPGRRPPPAPPVYKPGGAGKLGQPKTAAGMPVIAKSGAFVVQAGPSAYPRRSVAVRPVLSTAIAKQTKELDRKQPPAAPPVYRPAVKQVMAQPKAAAPGMARLPGPGTTRAGGRATGPNGLATRSMILQPMKGGLDLRRAALKKTMQLYRGCTVAQATQIRDNGSAGGAAANILTSRPTEDQVKEQVGEVARYPEYTTSQTVARGFAGAAGVVVVVEIELRYLREGSGVEAGWVALDTAPVKFLGQLDAAGAIVPF